MNRICHVRHGETEWNRIGRLQGREDIDLNATGLQQAASCAEYLTQHGNWQRVISSPLKRAYQTTE